MTHLSEFSPDWVSPPGDTVAALLRARSVSALELARSLGTSAQAVDALIAGRATITFEQADGLARLLGGSQEFWVRREAQYRDALARSEGDAHTEDGAAWLASLPVRDMVRLGWLRTETSTEQQVDAVLRFFDCASIASWREEYRRVLLDAAFKTSPTHESQPGAVAAWLRRGEIEAAAISCAPWSAEEFQRVLPELRALTRKRDPAAFLPTLRSRCAECGVAVVVARAPSGCRASGATRFLSAEVALLMLSFRHLSDDHFWFSFFHEAGHLVLHSPDSFYVEGATEAVDVDETEAEANLFAERLLVPNELQAGLRAVSLDHRSIIRFARDAGISPGIVVGQLQHQRRLAHGQMNSLKRRYAWRDA